MLFLTAISIFVLGIGGYIVLIWRAVKLVAWLLFTIAKGLYRLARAGFRAWRTRRARLNRERSAAARSGRALLVAADCLDGSGVSNTWGLAAGRAGGPAD